MSTHLKYIKVEGFKSIKKLDLNLGSITLLLGANGSGKSNFISVFTFLSQLSQGRLQTYVEKNGGANNFFHFGNKQTKEIRLHIEVGENGYQVRFSHGTDSDNLVFMDESCSYAKVKGSSFYLSSNTKGESGLLPNSSRPSEKVRDYTRKYLNGCRVYHFHDTSASADFKKTVELNANDYLYSNAGNIAAFLYRLKNEFVDSYNDITSSIKTVTPFFHDFYLQPQGDKNNPNILLKWLHKDHDVPFSANQLSDGTARFICLATLFLQPYDLRPYTIILDEPELGLHPAALDVLADIIKTTAKNRSDYLLYAIGIVGESF